MGILSSIIGGVAGLGQGVLNWFSQDSANKINEKIARENLGYQREANALNEALTREQWARDDNAISRRVADLTANGLSKTLAAGNAAANSSPISVKPLQNDYGQVSNPLDVLSALQMSQNFARGSQEIKNMRSQEKLLKTQEKDVEASVNNKIREGYNLEQQGLKLLFDNLSSFNNLARFGTKSPSRYAQAFSDVLGFFGFTPQNTGRTISLGSNVPGLDFTNSFYDLKPNLSLNRSYPGVAHREGANMYDAKNPRWDLNKIQNPNKPKVRGSYYRVGIHNEPLNYTRF